MALSSVAFDSRKKHVEKECNFNIGDAVQFSRSGIFFKGTVIKLYDNSALIELYDTPAYDFNNTVCNYKRLQLM